MQVGGLSGITATGWCLSVESGNGGNIPKAVPIWGFHPEPQLLPTQHAHAANLALMSSVFPAPPAYMIAVK